MIYTLAEFPLHPLICLCHVLSLTPYRFLSHPIALSPLIPRQEQCGVGWTLYIHQKKGKEILANVFKLAQLQLWRFSLVVG